MNNPYLYHPHPLCRRAADDIFCHIADRPDWQAAFSQGKMVGVLMWAVADDAPTAPACPSRLHALTEAGRRYAYLVAYSGVVSIDDPEGYFVPPIYDLSRPGDFYRRGEAEISAINRQIADLEAGLRRTDGTQHDDAPTAEHVASLRALRKEKSAALQRQIFARFNLVNCQGTWRNVVDIFADAGRGLPPGGTGECCAPRLLHYFYRHVAPAGHGQPPVKPLALAEFWYGTAPRSEAKAHRAFYPSCIEKCSPLLRFLLPPTPLPAPPVWPTAETADLCPIVYEDAHLVVVAKPSGLLSTPAKDLTLPNVETWLHHRYPEARGPMLIHRLDQATSGLLIATKDASTHRALTRGGRPAFTKRYVALLTGTLPSACGVVTLPLCPNPDDRPRQVVDHQYGKASVTRYAVLQRLAWHDASGAHTATLVALYPLTGRTHQLRLHCASPEGLGHPIVGDGLYQVAAPVGTDCLSVPPGYPCHRLLLHAETVTLVHPLTGQTLTLSTPGFVHDGTQE